MAQVDPRDDTITRFIVNHFRYDPERHERRHVVVAAFDNEPEFLECVRRVSAELEQRRHSGEDVDAREHISGVVHQPGDLRRAANGHLVKRAIKHRVSELPIDKLELPANVAVARSKG